MDEYSGIINTDGYDEYGEVYSKHPDSHIVFKGYKLLEWENLVKKIAAEVMIWGIYLGILLIQIAVGKL